ncbi:MAG TPA: hypothetical protein VG054_05140, partial [Acidimicrobiales bacterium]|nr:hypothetical protein [Acidimicrobiales bacterium]
MRVESVATGALPSGLAALGVPVFWHGDGPRLAAPAGGLPEGLQLPAELDPSWCRRHGFTGKVEQTVTFRSDPSVPAPSR